MTAIMQDRLQERYRRRKRTMTSFEGVIRLLTDFRHYFSHGSRAGQTTTTVAGGSNGGNYNNGGSTTAENPTTLVAAIDSTTTATTITSELYEHYEHMTPLFTTDTTTSDTVDLINPLPGACSHYLCMLHLPQARLPQPTVFDGTTHTTFPRMDARDTEFLSISNYAFIQQLDLTLQCDQEITLDEVMSTTEVGAARIIANTEALVTLQTKRTTPEAKRPLGRDNDTIDAEIRALQGEAVRQQAKLDTEKRRIERGGGYLNYVLTHGSKVGTETNNCTATTKKHSQL